MSDDVLAGDLSEVALDDLDGVEPDRTVVAYAYDADIYEVDDETDVVLRDNPACVWVEEDGEDLYCAETGEPIQVATTKLGQNDMGSVTTGDRLGCPYHEPAGPNAYTGSYDHKDIWSMDDFVK